MTEAEWAYLAGFFDGEGCISLHTRYKKDGYRVRLTISQSDPKLKTLYKQTGIGRIHRVEPSGRFKSRPNYQWIINAHKEVELFLSHILPYLRFKKRQARWAILLCDRSLHWKEQVVIAKKVKKAKRELARSN